ncbi:signal peptidase I [uncultured Mucilaginibacter sp.]|uniref:signal peptidase I n=1 Tax=uncultured Mucilaginibacter sp. TaxID=797541 RepID=UPI0025ED3C91|nr:signal peptidase I [uncultured Mucilaginibacter sp.]
MELGSYIGVLLFASPIFLLALAGYWKLFQKAGRKGWEALIPFYSDYVMLKISGRPAWWMIWLFLPLASTIVGAGILVDFIKSYGKFTAKDRAKAIILGFIYLPKWGFENKTAYLGPSASPGFRNEYPKSRAVSSVIAWGQAIFFAVFTALIIRTFFIEAYVIPTPSMERTLLVGDNIFVSKLNYGARVPMTPLSFPFANHTLPNTNLKSYWDGWELPYFRLPGFSSIKRGEVIVFNYPQDTMDNRPIDKKEFYIKRCAGIEGDTVSQVDEQVFINGKLLPAAPGEQQEYQYETATGVDVNPQLLTQLNITQLHGEGSLPLTMTKESADRLKRDTHVKFLNPIFFLKGVSDTASPVFPHMFPMHVLLTKTIPDYHWNVDNFGPIIIPKKGWTVKLDSMTFPLYERAIEVYEHNKLEVKGADIFINGKKTNSYTFKMDYYWVLGDNRHDSEDSRYWGFVPEDHISGKAVFIWMSWDSDAPLLKKIRWERILGGIK